MTLRDMPSIAFLGLGAIGAPMAKHLKAPDFELAVWNRTSTKAATFAARQQRATFENSR